MIITIGYEFINSLTIFKRKTLLITGGTGSFGNAVLNRFLNTNIKEIRIFSAMKKNRMMCARG
jgi:UDP-N-acetylglucosamine 4,6-dehydratase/5-epimerase